MQPQMTEETVRYRGVEQLVARQAHNLEVVRSSRTSATNKKAAKPINQGLAAFSDI